MREGLTPAPLTLPAHVSLFSGLDPDRHGVRENDSFQVPDRSARPYTLLAEDLRAAGYETAAFVSGQPLESRYGVSAGFNLYDDTGEEHNPRGALSFRERPAEQTVDRALAYLRARQRDTPWFMFVHVFDAHDPYRWHGDEGGLDPSRPKDRYLSEIRHIDREIGRLLAALPDGGQDVLLIVLADHGEGLGDHGEMTHGYTLHQSTLRVPFLLKPPKGIGVEAFRADGAPGRLIDVYPTVLSIVGLDAPPPGARDGRDLTRPPPDDWHAFAETLYPYYQFQYAHRRACFDPSRKLVTGGGRDDLYAWRDDPEELQSIAEAEPARVEQLMGWLTRHGSRPGRGRAHDVAVTPQASMPYMGGRPLALPLEPDAETNEELPRVEERWDVLRALDTARYNLRQDVRKPHLAAVALAPHKAEMDTNPSLLWWSARAAQLQARMPGLSSERVSGLLDEAAALYGRHYERFRDPKARDGELSVLMDRAESTLKPEDARAVLEVARGVVAVGEASSRTHLIRARAHELLGDLGSAIEALEEAGGGEDDPERRRNLMERLEGLRERVRDQGRGASWRRRPEGLPNPGVARAPVARVPRYLGNGADPPVDAEGMPCLESRLVQIEMEYRTTGALCRGVPVGIKERHCGTADTIGCPPASCIHCQSS
jgi:arylsulfatase A-like enzyme